MPENISAQLHNVQQSVKQACLNVQREPESVQLIAVSKKHSPDAIVAAYAAGHRHFGENYVQELVQKYEQLHDSLPEAHWHYIGSLQRNKVKYLAPFVHLIHGVDSLKLAKEISKRAVQHSRVIDILLQVNTSNEESKSGCLPEHAEELFSEVSQCEGVRVVGFMTMAERSGDAQFAAESFAQLRGIRDNILEQNPNATCTQLSMGMSGDYEIAIAHGATMVRIGTAIFGQRTY